MLRNFEEMKMVLISSTTNEWPEIDDQNLMASTNMGMEKASQDQIQQQQQQQQAVLKCPRCDSTNTKFCYYNNYSLSQPRHFCKACKRYWTRGGTLRNVPVGGGCRKNKRVKRPPPASASASASVVDNSPSSATNPISTTTPSTTINPLFYNTHSNSELNLSFPRFNNSRVDSGLVYDFDHFHPLGFSSGQLMANDVTSQTLLSSSYNSIPNFGSLNSSCLAPPTMANSLLASNVQQQKFISGNSLGSNNNFLEFGRYEDDMQLMQVMKEVKTEDCQNKLNQIQQIGSSDPNNSVFWSAINGVGSWLDPANIGSNSVSSLI